MFTGHCIEGQRRGWIQKAEEENERPWQPQLEEEAVVPSAKVVDRQGRAEELVTSSLLCVFSAARCSLYVHGCCPVLVTTFRPTTFSSVPSYAFRYDI